MHGVIATHLVLFDALILAVIVRVVVPIPSQTIINTWTEDVLTNHDWL